MVSLLFYFQSPEFVYKSHLSENARSKFKESYFRHKELQDTLHKEMDTLSPQKFGKLSKEIADLSDVSQRYTKMMELQKVFSKEIVFLY